WAAGRKGNLLRYNSASGSFTAFSLFSHSPYCITQHVTKLLETASGDILAGTRHQGFKLFNTKTHTYSDLAPRAADGTEIYVNDIVNTGNNQYWIGTYTGIYIYNGNNSRITHLQKDNLDATGLTDNKVNSLCRDSEGGVWIGTNFGGINYYNKQNTLFEAYRPVGEANVTGNVIRQVAPATNGNFWAGTEDNGLYYFDAQQQTFKRHNSTYKHISALLQVDNELWIGKMEEGMDVIDVNNGRLLRSYREGDGANDLRSNYFISFYKARNGSIYAGTSRGVYIYNTGSKKFNIIKSIPAVFTSCIYEDEAGNIWLGSYFSGVFVYHPSINQGEALTLNFSNDGRNNNTVTSVCEDDLHNIWFSSESGGIGKYDLKSKLLRLFTTKDGQPANNTFKILKDDNGLLWVSTSRGIASIDVKTNIIKAYSSANGLQGDQFNYDSGYRSPDGKLYFGSTQGLISFNPARFTSSIKTPPLYITGIQVDNKELAVGDTSPLKKSLLFTDELTLNHDQSSFSIDFAALSYISPQATSYKYKMEGFEQNWTILPANRKAYFTKLPPGTYTFKVNAATDKGQWGPEKNMVISITPPWWLSNVAYLFYACITGLCIYTVIRYYHQRNEQKNKRRFELLEHEKDKEIYEAKIDFFTQVAHEIRTPLTLIAAPLEKIQQAENLSDVKDNAHLINKSTNRLINLTNQLLDFRKTESKGYQLNFVKTDLVALLHDIYDEFRPSALKANITCTLSVELADLYGFADVEAMHKILSNLLNNAIKYAASTVDIKLSHDISSGNFRFTISNNGPLIPEYLKDKIFEPFYRLPSSGHITGSGIGLALARSLTELHHGNLELQSPSTGLNTFTLTIPEHQDIEFDFTNNNEDLPGSDSLIDQNYKNIESPVILLVEDNPDILQFLIKELNTDHQIIQAANGQKGLELLRTTQVHLILSDVMMPVMDGIELCRYVKTDPELSHIPMVLLTAKNTIESKIEGLETGADAYIEKPFSPAHVRAQIASLIANRLKVKDFYARSPVAGISSIANSKTDEQFLEKLNTVILNHIADPELSVEQLSALMNMSSRNLSRKIK
ncbi:MAG: response regulator, partial [Sphingobacteriaceae bacterium]